MKDEAKLIEPLHPDGIRELERTVCPTTDTKRKELTDEFRFSYRSAIGELLFAYMLCHLDIEYDMAELSKFSQNPARCHYVAVKRVFRYLRQTKDWVLIFWIKETRDDLPNVWAKKNILKQQLPNGRPA